MALTPELVARVARSIEDTGPDPTLLHHSEADYDDAVAAILAARGPDEDVWLFAYGSLIWKPACSYAEERLATAHGWHRAFCLKMTRWRGTKEQPGLMMSLDRGGQCRGVAYRLSAAEAAASLGQVFRREMTIKPPNNVPRWLPVTFDDGQTARAVGFVMNRKSRFYAGRLPLDEVAAVLATAAGHVGSCAEYLHNTVAHLEARGIRDRNLWRLQELVAERIAAAAR